MPRQAPGRDGHKPIVEFFRDAVAHVRFANEGFLAANGSPDGLEAAKICFADEGNFITILDDAQAAAA